MSKNVKFFNLALVSLIILLNSLIIISTSNFTNEKAQQQEFKCLKCHKGSKSLPNIVKEKNISSGQELRFLIRKGPKAGLHGTVPDEDLEKAIQYLGLE